VRSVVDRERLRRVLEALSRAATGELRIYLVGGTTAVEIGWRASTVDIDLVMRPDDDGLLRAIPEIKDRLSVNIELASPADFIPVPEGWEERSPRIERIGRTWIHHYDLYAQALAKIERGHDRDRTDVREIIARGLVDRSKLREYFSRIEPMLYRFPAIDGAAFRRALEESL
jgi:hypothetical protein